MSATHRIDNESRLITTVWEGEATDEAFIASLNKYHDEILSDHNYAGYSEIVDLRKANPLKLTVGGLLKIGRIAYEADKRFSIKKMALIVGSDFALRLAQLYIFYRNLGDPYSKKISAFKNVDAAYNWIRSDVASGVKV